jgi:hypothetical protein
MKRAGTGQPVRVAWALEWAFVKKGGRSFAGNTFLSEETGVSEKHVNEALRALEDAGAIVRVTVRIGRKRQRVIYPSTTIIDREDTPRNRGRKKQKHDPETGENASPKSGGHNSKRTLNRSVG